MSGNSLLNFRKIYNSSRHVIRQSANSVKSQLSINRESLYFLSFLLLACYVHNIAKRSIWDQFKKEYILKTDRRPTLHLEKFQMAISPRGVVRSTLCLVLRRGFRGRRIKRHYFRFRQIQDLGKFKLWYLSGGSSDLLHVLGCHFPSRQIEWRYFQFDQIHVGKQCTRSN